MGEAGVTERVRSRRSPGGEPVYTHTVKRRFTSLTREEREEIVRQALWGGCGAECEFCSGCDNRGGGRIDSMYQPYIDGEKEIAEINAEYRAPFVR